MGEESHSGRAARRLRSERDQARAILLEVCAMINARGVADGDECAPIHLPQAVSALLSYSDEADAHVKALEAALSEAQAALTVVCPHPTL